MEHKANLNDLFGLRVEVILTAGVRIEGVFDPAPEGLDDSVKVGPWFVRLGEIAAYRVSEGDA